MMPEPNLFIDRDADVSLAVGAIMSGHAGDKLQGLVAAVERVYQYRRGERPDLAEQRETPGVPAETEIDMTSPFEDVPECICDRCSCALDLDDMIAGPDGETLCDTCACEVQDDWDSTAPARREAERDS